MAHIAPYSLHGDTIELVTKDYKRSQLQLCAFFARLELKKSCGSEHPSCYSSRLLVLNAMMQSHGKNTSSVHDFFFFYIFRYLVQAGRRNKNDGKIYQTKNMKVFLSNVIRNQHG